VATVSLSPHKFARLSCYITLSLSLSHIHTNNWKKHYMGVTSNGMKFVSFHENRSTNSRAEINTISHNYVDLKSFTVYFKRKRLKPVRKKNTNHPSLATSWLPFSINMSTCTNTVACLIRLLH
jgi:hypothetical protein